MAVTRNRKIGIAVAGGALVAGVFAASAASLGPMTATSLGTTATVVATCQTTGLGVNWGTSVYAGAGTATDTTGSTFNVPTLTLTGVAAPCVGKSLKVVVADAAGLSLATETGPTVAVSPTTTVTLSTAVDTKKVYQVTVTIYG
ncbi:MAG: hypothetical protein ACOYD0_12115 [Candidatus Nanopelagicales bacterium]